jgi:hypothetical protein
VAACAKCEETVHFADDRSRNPGDARRDDCIGEEGAAGPPGATSAPDREKLSVCAYADWFVA